MEQEPSETTEEGPRRRSTRKRAQRPNEGLSPPTEQRRTRASRKKKACPEPEQAAAPGCPESATGVAEEAAQDAPSASDGSIRNLVPIIEKGTLTKIIYLESDQDDSEPEVTEVIDLIQNDPDADPEFIGRQKRPVSEKEVKVISLEKALVCSICFSNVSKSTSTSCGHIFCYECILASIKHTSMCPICRCRQTPESIHRIYFS